MWQHQYGFTHIGCIKRVVGSSFGVAATNDALDLVSYFLSSVNGSSVSAVLPCGLNAAAETVWEDWGSVKRTVHPWPRPISWFDATLTHELPDLFQGFSQRWHAPDDQRVLRYATAFYQEGNDPRPLQTALNSAVSGLELMAWVNLVRDGGMDRSAFEKQGVRPKTFRSLLCAIGVDTRTVPTDFPELRRSGRLGHDAVWHWRGRFTHPRIGEIEVDHDLLTETSLVATWYLELVLLSWFGYNGEYGRRRKTGRWVGNTETVPWVST